MLKYVFSGLGVVMILVLGLTFLITGKFDATNLHLAAYGFILAGIGYIIEMLKKQNKTSADHLKYVLDKNHKEITEEIRGVRSMILTLEDRKGRKNFE